VLPEDPRFIADVHMKTLVRKLRMLGFDTLYDPNWLDEDLARVSKTEARILLSRDRQLLMRNAVTRGIYVRNTDPDEQILEVITRFDLLGRCSPLSRCIPCNGRIERLESNSTPVKANENSRFHPDVDTFYRCKECGKIYWEGSHVARMREAIERIRLDLQ
jgi:uncharacterized protein with PIN domain